jgi:hypothetical protein
MRNIRSSTEFHALSELPGLPSIRSFPLGLACSHVFLCEDIQTILETQTEDLERIRSIGYQRSKADGMIQLSFGVDDVSEISSNIGIGVANRQL